MQKEQLITTLEGLGLTENESKVYLASLILGPATVLKISRAAEIKRTTVYAVVESLKQKGLMSIEVRGFKKLFVAENPDQLETILTQRNNLFRKTFSQFKELYNISGEDDDSIKYYDGLSSIKTVYERILTEIRPGGEYLTYGNSQDWLALDEKYFLKYMKQRAERSRMINYPIKLLLVNSERARKIKRQEKNFNFTVKLLPKGKTFTSNVVITRQRLVIHQLITPTRAVVITNKSAIETQRELFYVIWDSIND